MASLQRKALLVAAVAVPTLVGGWVLQERVASDNARLFEQVLSVVADRFVDTVDTAGLYQKAAQGLVEQLNDPYSQLFTPKESQRFSTTSTGRYAGLGMQIDKQADNIVVVRVFPNTPAEHAGVVEGDRIIGVDTVSTRGWSTQQVSDALLGTPGTRVNVRFARPGVVQPIEHPLTRAIIHVPAVPYAVMLDSRIGYVYLQQFNETAAEELTTALNRLSKEGAQGVILDLRTNPGGILDQALSISELFLRDGQEIVSVRPRQGKVQHYVAQRSQHLANVPLVLMVNGLSASASEIVAGALQDHDRALLVGTTSFGKGLVQSLYPLDGGYTLKLTTAKWYTPSGRSIQKDRTNRGGALRGAGRGAGADEGPDSLETDSVKKNRPAFRSDAGRLVYGGGGITPDVILPEDTLTTAEQELAKVLAPKSAIVRAAVYDFALDLKGKVRPDVAVQPSWRVDFYRRLAKAGVKVDARVYDAGAGLVDRWLLERVVKQSFGDSAFVRRSIADGEDAQLIKALDLIRRGHTQQELFALAQPVTARQR
jgi:carboxyl-terminal processing protease